MIVIYFAILLIPSIILLDIFFMILDIGNNSKFLLIPMDFLYIWNKIMYTMYKEEETIYSSNTQVRTYKYYCKVSAVG